MFYLKVFSKRKKLIREFKEKMLKYLIDKERTFNEFKFITKRD
jgi:hypothetical protein